MVQYVQCAHAVLPLKLQTLFNGAKSINGDKGSYQWCYTRRPVVSLLASQASSQGHLYNIYREERFRCNMHV